MDCEVPLLEAHEEWAYNTIANLVKNIAYSESVSYEKLNKSVEIIDKELMTNNIDYENPNISQFLEVKRTDAGIYSKVVFDVLENIKKYKFGYSDLETYGFKLKRGTNLQRRDLGRSIKTRVYRSNYNILVYPSDISDGGYITKTIYIGAKNPVSYLKKGDILFSAEGTVGKVFVICDSKLKFITNIHGMIIYPKDHRTSIKKSIFLGIFLNYLRAKGVIERLTAGGQGGSLAVGYWHNILIPNFVENVITELSELYYNTTEIEPSEFSLETIKKSGIFQLNNLRMISISILQNIVSDIKQGKLRNKESYFVI